MFGADKGKADRLDGSDLSIGIVQARFNDSITGALAGACLAELAADPSRVSCAPCTPASSA